VWQLVNYYKEYFDRAGWNNILAKKIYYLIQSKAGEWGYSYSVSLDNNTFSYNLNGVAFVQIDFNNNLLIIIPGRSVKRKHSAGLFRDIVSEYSIDFDLIEEENLQIRLGENSIPLATLIYETMKRRLQGELEGVFESLKLIIREKILEYGELSVVEEIHRVDFQIDQISIATLEMWPIPRMILRPGQQYVGKMEIAYDFNSKLKKEPDEIFILLGEIGKSLSIAYEFDFDEDFNICLDIVPIEKIIELSIQLRLGHKSTVKLEGYRYMREDLL
jgi:hypothetical protein